MKKRKLEVIAGALSLRFGHHGSICRCRIWSWRSAHATGAGASRSCL